MDSLISAFQCTPDADLMLCQSHGIAYQRTPDRVQYGDGYWQKVSAYENTDIARKVNAGRCALLMRHLPKEASVLDIGAGTGAFVREARAWGFAAKGCDAIPAANDRLRDAGLYADNPAGFDAVTCWDVIEHLEEPAAILRNVRHGSYLFASIPVFEDLTRIRESRHYRPSEHLYYFSAPGFVRWMALYGYQLRERSSHEIEAGRESIGAFAFCREPAVAFSEAGHTAAVV